MNRKQDHSVRPALGSVTYWPVYNLFRHKLTPDLLCAVPEDCPVPRFIEGSAWRFAGRNAPKWHRQNRQNHLRPGFVGWTPSNGLSFSTNRIPSIL